MTTPSRPEASVTADDVRNVNFEAVRRGGYDTHEVNAFLDRVAESLSMHEQGAGSRPSEGAPQLHDPEGAAQRLLAAAQLTSDTLTSDAEQYAATQRGEADAYAASVRAEADEHAATVTTTAETQAETIRSLAVEEARSLVEEARAALVEEISGLEATRSALQGDCAALEGHLETQRAKLLESIDAMRSAVEAGDLAVDDGPEDSGAGLGDHDLAPTAPADEADVTAAVDVPLEAADPEPEVESPAELEADGAVEADAASDPEVEEVEVEQVEVEELVEAAEVEAADDAAVAEVDAEPAESDAVEIAHEEGGEGSDDGPISVFDLVDDVDDPATSADWLDEAESADTAEESQAGALGLFDADQDLDDDEPAALDPAPPDPADLDVADSDPADDPGEVAASIFDIDADDSHAGPPTQAMPVIDDGRGVSGDRFFEELRQADLDENMLGPLDEDTDAALAAFFEPDDEEEERWSDRFGRRR